MFDGRQRPLQFSEDCGGFDFSKNLNLSLAGIYLDDQLELARNSSCVMKVETCLHCSHEKLCKSGTFSRSVSQARPSGKTKPMTAHAKHVHQ